MDTQKPTTIPLAGSVPVTLSPPGIPATDGPNLESLQAQIKGLMDQVKALQEPGRHGLTRTKRITEHQCTLREYRDDAGELKGMVLRLYDWKEQKDPTEAKRFIGVCKLNVVDPRTKKVTTVEGVNGIEFLNNARAAMCRIIGRERKEREWIDPRPGVGIGHAVDQSGRIVPGSEIEFVVKFMDERFTLDVLDGDYKGCQVDVTVANAGDSPINL